MVLYYMLLFFPFLLPYYVLSMEISQRYPFPKDLVIPLLLAQTEQEIYPWKKYCYIYRHTIICKDWKNEIESADIQSLLQIPAMHYAAMTNNVHNIIEQDLQSHSTLAPDPFGFKPIHYAIGSKQHEAIKLFYIGYGFVPNVSDSISHTDTKLKQLIHPIHPKKDNLDHLLFIRKIYKAETFTESLDLLYDNHAIQTISTLICYHKKIQEIANANSTQEQNDIKNLLQYKCKRLVENTLNYVLTTSEIKTIHINSACSYFIEYSGSFSAWVADGDKLLHTLCSSVSSLPWNTIIEKYKDIVFDPNIKNYKGKTPLHYAATYGHTEAVQFLLAHSADKTIVSDQGKTALEYAEKYAHAEIVLLLK